MKLHRFIGSYNLKEKDIKITNPENIKQIKGVLRLEVGDELILCDGRGGEARVEITEISKNEIAVKIIEVLPTLEPERKVALFLAILKKENFELAVQKAVECGASEIIPVITERTVKTGLNMDRLRKIILEASEQCGRSTMPHLGEILKFENALAFASLSDEKVIFHPEAPNYAPKSDAKKISIFVGPEGGWSEAELALARSALFTSASLGELTLRGETAAIVATYLATRG